MSQSNVPNLLGNVFTLNVTLFEAILPDLNAYLDAISSVGAPPDAKGNPTPIPMNAYATATNGGTPPSALTSLERSMPGTAPLPQALRDPKLPGSTNLFTKVVDGLTVDNLNFLSGLNFANPRDTKANRAQVVASCSNAWDAAAAAYRDGKRADGDKARAALEARMKEFDDAIASAGAIAVTPDK